MGIQKERTMVKMKKVRDEQLIRRSVNDAIAAFQSGRVTYYRDPAMHY